MAAVCFSNSVSWHSVSTSSLWSYLTFCYLWFVLSVDLTTGLCHCYAFCLGGSFPMITPMASSNCSGLTHLSPLERFSQIRCTEVITLFYFLYGAIAVCIVFLNLSCLPFPIPGCVLCDGSDFPGFLWYYILISRRRQGFSRNLLDYS